MSEAADCKAAKSYATVKKKKKTKKLFGKKQTTTSSSSIPDDDAPALPPKTPERTFGQDRSSFPKLPPTSTREDGKNESKINEKREDKVVKKTMEVEEIKVRTASSRLKKVDEKITTMKNKYHTNDGRAENRMRHKYGREEIWAERRPNDQDDDHDEPLYGDERDEKPKAIKKTQREDWEQRKRAFQKRAREESWAEKRPVNDDAEDEDDDIYGAMNPYKNDDDDDDDKVATDVYTVDNISNNAINVTKIENDKTRINNWEKVDSNDEDNSEENEADFTTGEGNTHQKEAFEDEQPKEVNEEGHRFTQDNEIQIGIIAHSLDIDEMDSGREQGNENDNHDYDDINDNVDDVDDATMQPLESADTLNYKPNYFVNSNIQMRADARRKRNKNKNNSDEDGQVNDDEDNSYYDKLYAAFNWDDPFHPSNIRPGLELCPVIVSNKGLGSRWPLRIERYIN